MLDPYVKVSEYGTFTTLITDSFAGDRIAILPLDLPQALNKQPNFKEALTGIRLGSENILGNANIMRLHAYRYDKENYLIAWVKDMHKKSAGRGKRIKGYRLFANGDVPYLSIMAKVMELAEFVKPAIVYLQVTDMEIVNNYYLDLLAEGKSIPDNLYIFQSTQDCDMDNITPFPRVLVFSDCVHCDWRTFPNNNKTASIHCLCSHQK